MKFKNNSFVVPAINHIIIKYIVIFAALIVTLFIFIYFLITAFINHLFPFNQTQNLLKNVVKMSDLEYNYLKSEHFVGENGDLMLFDETGKLLYTNDTTYYYDFSKAELASIPEYNSDLRYFLSEFCTPQGEKRFILTYERLKNDGVRKIQNYILMDQNLQIISSSFWVKRNSLTWENISYLTGENEYNYLLRKFTYKNPSGQKRILVFTTANHSQKDYLEYLQLLNSIWFYFVPIYILIIVCLIYCLSKSILGVLKPLEYITKHPYKAKSVLFHETSSQNVFNDIANKYKNLYDEYIQGEWERAYLNDHKNQLLADISHDLRTPITVIQGYSQALKDGIVPENEKNFYLDTINKKSEHVADLISTFHEYSMLNHPDMPISLKETNICSVLQIYFANKYHELELAGIELFAEIPEYKIYCNLDEKLFCRAIENLVNNSIKYNNSGTIIFIKVERQESIVKINIGDSGIGLPDYIIDELFFPFVTGEPSRSPAHGSGLGLSIAKKIIVSHHGTIEYTKSTQPLINTNFSIILPLLK